jgi:signal transduction histidine kinase
MLTTMMADGTGRPEPAKGLIALSWARWGFAAIPMLTVLPPATPWVWAFIAVTLLAAAPLLWMPTSPGWLLPVSMALVVAASGALWMLAPSGWVSVGMFSTTFYSVRTLSRAQSSVVVTINAAAILVWVTVHAVKWVDALLLYAILVVIVLLGLNRRTREAQLEQAELALARAQTATEEHARAAALAERTRIARDLHDVLAHSLAGLALNLQGARLMLVRDGASPDAVAQIERAQRLAADGLSEARKAVAALRDDPVPVARTVADLLAAYRLDTGAIAELTLHGEPRDLDTAAGTTVVRAVQEALVNTRKHAPAAEVQVTLTYHPDHVDVTVLDKQGRRPPEPVTAGYGLRGMRERVELLDGGLDSGPVEDGWRVHLTVPG